jgi:hypothetical protein
MLVTGSSLLRTCRLQAADAHHHRCLLHSSAHPSSIALNHFSRADRLLRRAAQTDAEVRERLETSSSVVTDEAVPEGHKGLHGFLYGDGGAEEHDSRSQYNFREVNTCACNAHTSSSSQLPHVLSKALSQACVTAYERLLNMCFSIAGPR